MTFQDPVTPQGMSPAQPPAAPPPPPTGGAASSNRQLMLVLSYLWILALVPLLSEKEDKEVQWHAKHGLVLFGAEIVVWVVLHIIFRIVLNITAGFGCLLVVLFPLLSLAFLALHIFCIIKAVNGQRLIIPGLSGLADKF
ncbi:MAG: hypothetical protein ACHQQS_11440 [Thermoanaerobaculales bacterium]